jgi:Protein of unknown function (DUF3224)
VQGIVRGTYRTTGWRQQEYGNTDRGPKLALAEKDLKLEGELEGSAAGRSSIVLWGTGSSVATGHVRITGRIGSRSGSFVVEETVKGGPAGATATWRIVPESGTDELAGVAGEGSWEWKPGAEQVAYTLSYRL